MDTLGIFRAISTLKSRLNGIQGMATGNHGEIPGSIYKVRVKVSVSFKIRLRVPRVWNMLPIHLRLCDSLEQFKRLLKAHLFRV